MSAYVVKPEVINQILSAVRSTLSRDPFAFEFLPLTQYRQADGQDFDLTEPERFAALGNELYAMNIQAVRARYPNDSESELPGLHTADGELMPYFPSSHPPIGHYRLYKLIGEYLYQCSEQSIPEWELCKAMQAVYDRLAHKIARQTCEERLFERSIA